MLEVLKIIKEKQQVAKRIIDEANIKAEKIKQAMLQKSGIINEDVYLAEIAQAEKRADELKLKANLGINIEIKRIQNIAEQQAEEIEIKAKINQEKAVNYVLDFMLNGRRE